MIKVVFFATPEIAVPSLEYLISKEDIEVAGVVTKIDKPKGRGQKLEAPPIKIAAEKHNVPVYQPRLLRNDTELIEKLKSLDVDFFVTFAYGQILSQEILDIPKYGTINLHASLLPKYRGANPIQRAIVNGDKVTGVTTMLTVVELDAGDICLNKEIDIYENMTDIELSQEISACAPEMLYCSLAGLKNQKICPVPQDIKNITHAGKFCKEDACVDWNKSAKEIHNLIRGLCSWPCCYTFFNDKNIKILRSKLTDKISDLQPGSLVAKTKEGLEITTGEGVILLVTVKPEGKGEMRATDWINGAKMQIGDKFVCQNRLNKGD